MDSARFPAPLAPSAVQRNVAHWLPSLTRIREYPRRYCWTFINILIFSRGKESNRFSSCDALEICYELRGACQGGANKTSDSSHQIKPNFEIRLLCIFVTIKQSMSAIRLLSNHQTVTKQAWWLCSSSATFACDSSRGCVVSVPGSLWVADSSPRWVAAVMPNVCVSGVRSPASLGTDFLRWLLWD